jgi:hypothetical protein
VPAYELLGYKFHLICIQCSSKVFLTIIVLLVNVVSDGTFVLAMFARVDMIIDFNHVRLFPSMPATSFFIYMM